MTELDVDLNPLHLQLDFDSLNSIKHLVVVPALEFPIRRFADTIGLLQKLILLPNILLQHGTLMRVWDSRTSFLTGSDDEKYENEEGKHSALSDAARWTQQELDAGRLAKLLFDESHTQMRFLTQNVMFRQSLRALLLQAIVSAWSSFELLANDCIVIIRSFRPGRKTYKIDYSYRSLKRIVEGFQSVLHSQNGILDILDSTDLVELEQTRHLIVHKAGIVDQLFARNTKKEVEIDMPLPLSVDDASRLINTSINVGVKLVRESGAVILKSMFGP